MRLVAHPALPALCALIALSACSRAGDTDVRDPYDVEVGSYQATIRRTAYGIPHILADDVPSVVYGTGRAFAQDHICTLADLIVKVRSERAATFGAGPDNNNLNSDIAWKALHVFDDAERLWFDLPEPLQQELIAYAAGYNDHLAEVGPSGLPRPCRDAEWVRPITHIDLLAHYLHLGQMGSGFYLLDYIATAAPPGASDRRRPPPDLHAFGERLIPRNGSNGLALGKQITETGQGMLVSNSHFEGEGERRWYELHQTVPGELDVYGVALMGVPLVNMGFNKDVAWTHTVSTTPRFLIYGLKLAPGNPTSYLYNGEYEDMTTEVVTVQVKGDDDVLRPYEHTLYRSRHGLMLNAPLVGWGGQVAYAFRDINAPNLGMIPAWWAMNRATSLDALRAAQADNGIPWVHTIAAGADGDVWFADTAAAPNLRPEAEAAYDAWIAKDFIARQFQAEGAYVLDGSDPVFDWVDADTTLPYAVPLEQAPQLRTDTFVTNSNENHWLANVDEPLEGYPMLYGPERAPRAGRTKMGQRLLAGLDAAVDLGEDGLFSFQELQDALLTYPAHHADVVKDQLVARCTGADPVEVRWGTTTETVDLTQACAVLDAWDGGLHVDARGAHLFREWLGSGEFEHNKLGPFVHAGDFDVASKVFADDFDADDPLGTPSRLAPAPEAGPDPLLVALGKAVLQLRDVDIALDARLGDVQFRQKGDERTACPGGKELEGSLMIADWRDGISTLLPREHAPHGDWVNPRTELTADGYPVNAGDTWLAAIAFTAEGPQGRAVLTFSQSADPDSPHYNDQAAVLAANTFRDIIYTEAAIQADPELVEQVVGNR